MQFRIPYEEQDSISAMHTENQDTKRSLKTKKKNKAEKIVEKYPQLFEKVMNIRTTPTLIPKREILWIIEEIYEAQIRKILRQKSRSAINLSKIFNSMIDRKYKHAKTNYQKRLSIIYSIEKYSEDFEFQVFLTFIDQNKQENILLYLYIRQFYKIYNNINFMHYSQMQNDPQKCFTLDFAQGREILTYAFEDDDTTMVKLTEAQLSLQNKKKVSYYQLIESIWNVDINFNDLNLMQNLLALHTIKSQRRLADFKTSQQNIKNYNYQNNQQEEVQEVQEVQEEEKKMTKSLSKQLNDIEENIQHTQLKEQIVNLQNLNVMNLEKDQQKLVDVLWLNKDTDISDDNAKILTEELKKVVQDIQNQQGVTDHFQPKSVNIQSGMGSMQKGILKKEENTPFDRVMAKSKKQFNTQDKQIQLETQDELITLVKELVENYVEKNNVKSKNLQKDVVIAINTIYKKIFFICLSIFLNEQNMFFKLVRETREQQGFFNEARQIYENLMDVNSNESVENFLRKMFENEQIATQLLFYLDFNFNQYEQDDQ